VNQWQELNHSSRWSAYHLWRNGQPVEENLESCPATAKLLEDVELCELGGIGPNVFFSALAPKTRVPPHHGATNARVIAHLPLIVPEDCGLRVGFEERCWREGEILVFDDTIENEAFNDSNELRVVMSFDLWNPLLSDADRQVAKILAETRRSFGN
jgi:aspartyl/asparaginyl beta-hydroxylase (cupin superfamily)